MRRTRRARWRCSASEPDLDVEVAQVEKDGIKLTVATWADSARERGAVAARVRAASLEKLRSEGLAFTPE